MKALLPDKAYEILKWICVIAIPALVILIKTVFPVQNIPYAEPIATTLTAIGLFIGALIGVSTISYRNKIDTDIKQIGEEVVEELDHDDIEKMD